MRLHPQVAEQNFLQRTLLLPACWLSSCTSAWASARPIFLGERERHRLGHDLAAGQIEVGAQPLDVDLEALGDLDDGASAPEVTSASVGNVIHSVCQPPGARSCSWTCAASRVATRLGATVAAESAAAAPTGLRLCGIVEEPPRPGAAGSNASPTSVCIISVTSRAILPQVPARMPKHGGDLGEAVAVGVPGRVGQRQVEQRGEPLGDAEAVLAQRGQRARGAAELQRQRFAAQPQQPLARAPQRRGIAGKLEPERHRQRVLHQRARDRERAAVASGERDEALDRDIEIGQQRVDRRAKLQHQRGVDDILAGGAPMHEAGGFAVARGDRLRERVDHGDGEVAGRAPAPRPERATS